ETCKSNDVKIQQTDIPETRDQYTALDGFDHLIDRCIATGHDEIRRVCLRRPTLLHCPESRIGKRLQYSVLNPNLALNRLSGIGERRSFGILFGGIADDGHALLEKLFTKPVAAAAFRKE